MKHFLFALVVILSMAGCSKKETPSLTPNSNTGSYKLDGTTIMCTGTATATSPASGNVDYLFVSLTTTPQPATGQEVLTIQYSKPRRQATTNYHPSAYTLIRSQQQPVYFDQPANLNASVLVTSGGGTPVPSRQPRRRSHLPSKSPRAGSRMCVNKRGRPSLHPHGLLA